jgi:4-amino-4-deoxy-L-arabinose transferase-like glycosyltransferase
LTAAAVAGVLVLGLALRLVGIRGAFPYEYHPDEPTDLAIALRMVHHASANPHWFRYPSLFFDLVAAVEWTVREAAALVGAPVSLRVPVVQTVGNAILRDATALLVARAVTLTASIALIGVAMWLCRLLTGRRAPMLVAGFLVAVNPILVRNGRWATPDMLAGLAATAALAGCVLVARNPSRVNYVLAGVLVGAAAGAKYNAAVVVVALLVAHAIAHERPTAHLERLVPAAIAAVLTFLVITPFAVLDLHTFLVDATYDVRHYHGGHAGNEGNSLVTNLHWLWSSMGPVLVLPFGAFLVRRHRRRLLVPASFAVVYFALVSAAFVRFERNLVPLLPALLVLAAIGGVAVVERVGSGRTARVAVGGVVALALAWPLVPGVQDAIDATRDPRASARRWIDRNVPAGSRIAVDAYAPWVDPTRHRPVPLGFAVVDRSRLERADAVAVVVTQNGSGRFLAGGGTGAARATFAWLGREACDRATFNRGSQRIWIFRLRC